MTPLLCKFNIKPTDEEDNCFLSSCNLTIRFRPREEGIELRAEGGGKHQFLIGYV